MAIWEVRVVYQNGDRSWENVWEVDTGSSDDVAPGTLLELQNFALTTLLSIYSVARIARRPAGTTNEFIDVIVDAAGLLPIGTNKAAPLFNVIRLFLECVPGRPGIKLLRGALVTADIIDSQGHISSTLRGIVENAAINLFNQASADGQSFVVGSSHKVAVSPDVDQLVQMRQLHRKRKKTLL